MRPVITHTTTNVAPAAIPAMVGRLSEESSDVDEADVPKEEVWVAKGACVEIEFGTPVAVAMGPVAAVCPSDVGNPRAKHTLL